MWSMRMSYLVCYDISDEKRLRKVFKTMRNFGDHLQYSVFECQLTPMDLARCRNELSEIIHHDEVEGSADLAVQGLRLFPHLKDRGP